MAQVSVVRRVSVATARQAWPMVVSRSIAQSFAAAFLSCFMSRLYAVKGFRVTPTFAVSLHNAVDLPVCAAGNQHFGQLGVAWPRNSSLLVETINPVKYSAKFRR
jgi:hypothetical protein